MQFDFVLEILHSGPKTKGEILASFPNKPKLLNVRNADTGLYQCQYNRHSHWFEQRTLSEHKAQSLHII